MFEGVSGLKEVGLGSTYSQSQSTTRKASVERRGSGVRPAWRGFHGGCLTGFQAQSITKGVFEGVSGLKYYKRGV